MSVQSRPLRAVAFAALSAGCLGALAQPPASSGASQAAAAPAQIKPGVWEMSTVIDDPANHSQRSAVSRSCVVPADVANPQRLLPVQREPGMQCENRDAKRDGSVLTWTVACKSASATETGSGKLSISALGYLGRAELELKKAGAKTVKIRQTFTGKWVEACS